MKLLDSRRLPGPNLLLDRPGAVIDVELGGEDPDLAIGAWRREIGRLLHAVGWEGEATYVRRYAGGASLAISAPVDALYSATELNEAAWAAACDFLEGGNQRVLARVAKGLRREIGEEERPRLRALLEAARAHAVPVVLDTREVSFGLGVRSRTWSLRELPEPGTVAWAALGRVPVALVTGTNGKTTTVRMLAAIGRAAGRVTGVSSTDWLAVGEEILARDDFAGPEGARQILRDARVEIAVLETARGGLLRRGLAVDRAEAALITNVASDHIGEFGVQDLEELADVKWVVTRALGADGVAVLNADDPRLVARSADAPFRVTWFSPDPANVVLAAHLRAGGTACTLRGDWLVLRHGARTERVARLGEVPVTLNGAALHNVANALGAIGLAHALGIPTRAIGAGLKAFRAADNPGRANLWRVGGATAVVDFAHNPHGIDAIVRMASRMPAKRRLLVIGQAGDRSDADIRHFARATAGMRFDRIHLKRLDKYARGRASGEAARLLAEEFRAMGYRPGQTPEYETETGAVRAALKWAREGDLLLLLTHEDRKGVIELLGQRGERSDG
jgi:UDP-N-acetylmuramyl tripeptide synthase